MGLRSGLLGQFGYAEESSWGTATAPTNYLPMIDESLTAEKGRLDSDSIYAGRVVRDSEQWDEGAIEAGGDLSLEVFDRGMETLLEHAIGSSTGIGPFTITPGTLDGKGLTIQIGKPDRGGTVNPWNFYGSKVASWELSCQAGQEARLSLTFSSKDVDKDGTPALGVFTPPAGLARLVWHHATVATIHGVTPKIKSLTFSGDNSLETDRLFLGAQSIDEQDEADLHALTGEAELEFSDETLFDAFWNGDEAAIVFTLARGAASLALTTNARLDGSAPVVEGRGKLTQTVPFTCIGDGSDADAFSLVYTAAA